VPTEATRAQTGAVTGVVIDDVTGAPISGARVSLERRARVGVATSVAGLDGRFAFTGVTAGNYDVAAMHPGYLRSAHGASPVNRSGILVAVRDGTTTSVEVRLIRPASIAGRVFSADGSPLVPATVRAYRLRDVAGRRAIAGSAAAREIVTDTTGAYRFDGLVAGDYVVVATPPFEMPVPSGSSARPNARVPTFHPAAPDLASATPIALGAGDDQQGVNVYVPAVRPVTIGAQIVTPTGEPAAFPAVELAPLGLPAELRAAVPVPRERPSALGIAIFADVPPGRYLLAARSQDGLWARREIDATQSGIVKLTIPLERGATISGRVGVDRAPAGLSLDLSHGMALVMSLDDETGTFSSITSLLGAKGEFTITGVPPGRYRLMATLEDAGSPWVVASAMVSGQDANQAPLVIQDARDYSGAVITLTYTSADIAGTIADAAGAPTSAYAVVVVPADRARWLPRSPHLRAVRPATDGSFRVADLPAGDYLVMAVSDLDLEAWNDGVRPELDTASAIAVTLSSGERRTLHLKTHRNSP
jgi:hypothetical protein